jgi:N-acetylmuramoyl-L-alanine amidase
MRKLTRIIVHCADTPDTMDIGVEEIRQWHRARGWEDVGYHYVVRRDGTVELGRAVEVIGAHAYRNNADTIGICMVGGKPGFNFTFSQLVATRELIEMLRQQFGPLTVIGHRDVDAGKTCPTFDAGILFG